MVYEGRGGEYSMPSWVSESWLKEHGCADEAFGDARTVREDAYRPRAPNV